jgi:hypothetical protein
VRFTFALHIFGFSSKRVVLARHTFEGGSDECIIEPRYHRRSGALEWKLDGALFLPSIRFIQWNQGQFRDQAPSAHC